MSGTSTLEVNGVLTDVPLVSQDVSLQSVGTHVGTANVGFAIWYGGLSVSFDAGQIFIADAGLYASINLAAAANVTWTD